MFIFFYKNINFCCPFCCGIDSFDIIQFKLENENNGNGIALGKKEIFKKYELTEEKCKKYKESKEQLSSLGDEIFWKYFFGKLAVDLILKKAEGKGIKSKEEEIKGKKEYIDDIFYKYLKLPDEFAKIFFEEKNKDNIIADGEKNIFDVSLDDIIFFAFLFIENIYLNDNEDVPGSLNVRKYFALKNLCTFYLKPKNEIKTKYSSTERSFDPAHIIQFFNNYIEKIEKDKEKCSNILNSFNKICENKRSSLMLSFMQEKDLVETLFNCGELEGFIRINNIKEFLNFDDKFFDPGLKEKFLNRFNNDPFKTINGDFNKKFKKIIFKEDFLKDLWVLYGGEVINSILKKNNTNTTNLETNNTNATNLETNNTNVINKNDLDIEKKMREPTVENNGKKGKNEQNITNQNVKNKGNTQQQFPRDEILKFENLNIYVGDKPEEDSFLNGFLIGLLNYRTDLVDIFKKKMNLGENNERSWEEWLSEQDNSLGNEKIDFKVGFSKLLGSKEEAFDKNLTPVDKYFCRMLLFLFKILSEENYDTINEYFSKLKDLTRQFFHVKKILKSVDGVFDVSAPDFYNTLFSFMELMYQKFLGNKGICGEKGYNIENGGGSNVDIRNIINKEQNLIRLFFGFYYIKPGKNKNFFLKHLYCGEVDNKKEEVSLDCLEKLYSEKYNVVSYCSNLIVPIQIYRENEISSNQQIKINNCEYRFKMTLNPGYYSGMINKNQKNAENNGCSFYMIDDSLYRTIYFVFSKVLNVKEEEKYITNFINIKNVKNILQKKYVTYFFVKRFNKEEPYDAICEKNISFDNKIQNNKDFLFNITQEQWRTTNDQKENIKKKKKEKKKASNDNKKDIEQIWKKIKNFYVGSEDNDKNCSDPFILPTYKVEGNIFDKINDWKEFMNIIKNNGAILPEEKKDEIEINTNENNINEIEINTNENKLNEKEINTNENKLNENGININENKLNKEINMCLNKYHDEITKLEPNDPNVVFLLLNCTNNLYKKLLKIINGNIKDKKTLCSIIFDKINSGKPWKFDKFDSFIKDFKEKNFEHIDNPESNVVESFYKGWKNFIEGLPFLIQNSLLLYGVSLVIKNIENVKIDKIDKIDINPQMTFRKNLLYVKVLLSSNLLNKYNNVYDKLILKSCPNQNIEEKDSIDKSQLSNSLNNFNNIIESLRKNFNFRKKNITEVLKALKKYNEDVVNIAEMGKKEEFEQLEENIEVIAHVVKTYLKVLKGNKEGKKNEKEKKNESKNKNENSEVALLKEKYFVDCFNGADKAESLYLFVIQSKIKELDEDIGKINLGIKELFVGENTKDIMWKTFSLFTDSQNNNGPNKNDNNNVFKTIYEEFLKYYNKLSKMYEEKVEENNIDNDISDLDNNEEKKEKKEKNKNKKKEEEEKEVLFRQEMIDILLDYILNFNIVKGTEKNLNEQVKNNWENNEEYFKDLLFGLKNWSNNCFLNSSIQLLLRCWDCFEEISTYQKEANENFFNWLKSCVENKSWKIIKDQKGSEKLGISLNFIYEFFKFGKMVNDEKEKFRNKNKKITKDDAEAVYKKMGQQHKKLVDLWRLYGTNVGNDESFESQSDSYDALRLFSQCLQYVMCVFDDKQKPIENFSFSWKTIEDLKNVNIKFSCDNSVECILYNLNIQNIEELWEKNVLKKTLLDKMPLYCKLFGVFQGNVNNCTRCNVFSCNGTISCVENVHIDDFVSGQIVKNECYKCEICKKNDKIIRHEFFIPIGKYFFWGNADAATNKYGNKKSKKLESWRDRIDEFGEGNSYRNIGVGLHSGSEGEKGSGHYWAYIRSRYLNNLYFKCEDSISPYKHPLVVYTPDSGNHERVYLFEKIDD